jgi:endonuclease III
MATVSTPTSLDTRRVVATLLKRVSGRFSTELGLNLSRDRPRDIFLWFLAAVLYGARISGSIVAHTHAEFVQRGLVTAEQILKTGWDGLVEVLDAGGYVRYDFKTATKLLEVMQALVDRYAGDLNRLHDAAIDARDLEGRLKALGRGIGDVTVGIFLRELRGIWPKADPPLSPLAVLAANHLWLWEPHKPEFEHLNNDAFKRCWSDSAIKGKRVSDFESSLVRLGRDYCRKGGCESCPMREYCADRPENEQSGTEREAS